MTDWTGLTDSRAGVSPPLVIAAHGTRDPEGPRALAVLADRVREQLPAVGVHVAYVDVVGPTLHDVLGNLPAAAAAGSPVDAVDAVVLPYFLTSGYHVRVDVPAAVRGSGIAASVTPALGTSDEVIEAVAERALEGGFRSGDSVVLAAAGSADPDALAEVEQAARALATVLDAVVTTGYAATATPTVHDAVAAARSADPDNRVALASYLLAPGLFQQRLDEAAADVVAAPIGSHPRIVDLVVRRYNDAIDVD